MEIVAMGGPFPWTVKELKEYAKGDGQVAKIMYEIAFFQSTGCKDKEAWLDLLKMTAEDIIQELLG